MGIPASQIILMIADDMGCNPRNPKLGHVHNNANQHRNVNGDDVKVDYRGYCVDRVLTGRTREGIARSKKLLTDPGSNVLIYLTGQGGDGFLEFQDAEGIGRQELADATEQMWQKRSRPSLMDIAKVKANKLFRHVYGLATLENFGRWNSPRQRLATQKVEQTDSVSEKKFFFVFVYFFFVKGLSKKFFVVRRPPF